MWSNFQLFGLSVSCVFIFILFSHHQLSRGPVALYTSKKMALVGQDCHYIVQINFFVKSSLQVTEEVLLPLGSTTPVVNEM